MIAFDLQALQSKDSSERGIARYVAELARALRRDFPDAVDVFLWNDLFPYPVVADSLQLGDRLASFSEVRGSRVDVLHVNSPFEVPRGNDLLPHVHAERIVVTCYDLIPWLFPESYLVRKGADGAYRRRLPLIASADAVVTDSQSAGDDVSRLLGVDPRKVTVLGAGVGDQFVPPESPLDERVRRLRTAIPSIRSRFVLVPTAADWRKNSIAAIRAYAMLPPALRERHQMVMFCRLNPEQREVLDDECQAQGVTGQVIITGYVPDDVLVALYQSAELVMFPSVYEGFGLPVLEARRCGARVICSNSSSLPEVLVDVRARFSPYEPDAMADLMKRGLTDDGFMALLDAIPDPGFTWSLAAARLVGVYRGLQATVPERAAASPMLRLAVAGAFSSNDPDDDAAREVMRALDERADLVLTGFSPGRRIGIHAGWRCEMQHLATLPYRWAAGDFDAVVYLLSESDEQRALLPMVASVPGHAVVSPSMVAERIVRGEEARRRALEADDIDETDGVRETDESSLPGLGEFVHLACRTHRVLVTTLDDAASLATAGVDAAVVGDADELLAVIRGARQAGARTVVGAT